MLDKFNKLQPSVKFNREKELHNSSILYLTIHHEDKNLKFSIYRKPIQTDTIIRNSSWYPYEHKLSSINYLLNRLHTYPETKDAKETEVYTTRNIRHKNQYNTAKIKKNTSTKTKYIQWFSATKSKMCHIYIQQKRSKDGHKTFPKHRNKNGFPHTMHNTKHMKNPFRNREIQ
jgi:hypothetical protein